VRINPKLQISKIMSAFCYLQIETQNLKHEIESRFFDPLILFGESGSAFEGEDDQQTGDRELEMSRSLVVFEQFKEVIRRIVDLSKNIIYQMSGLFNAKEKIYLATFKKLVYSEIFDNLGDLLVTLYIVDLIIAENTNIKTYWSQYQQMLLMARTNPAKYGCAAKKLSKLEKHCGKLYTNIMSGNLFDIYLNGLRDQIRSECGDDFVFKNKTFREKYLEYIKYKIETVATGLQNPSDMHSSKSYFNLLINYALYRSLFNDQDSKVYKKLWSLQKNCPIIILYNNLCVSPGRFLSRKVPLAKQPKCDPKDYGPFLMGELATKDQEFGGKVELFYVKLVQWVIKMNSDQMLDTTFPGKEMAGQTEFLKVRANLIQGGLDMAAEIKRSMKTLILLYQTCGKQPSKARLHDIYRCIEMLKAIEVEFGNKRYIINQWVILINRYTSELMD
jgi:hypothetical protein